MEVKVKDVATSQRMPKWPPEAGRNKEQKRNQLCCYLDFNSLKRRILMDCWWNCKLEQPLWKPVWRFLDFNSLNLSKGNKQK